MNGNRVISRFMPTFPAINVNLIPPPDTLDEVQCSEADDVSTEGFQSGGFYSFCQADYGTEVSQPVCCGHNNIFVNNSDNVCSETYPYCIYNEIPGESMIHDNSNIGGYCVNLDEINYQINYLTNLKYDNPDYEDYADFYIEIFNKIIEIDDLKIV